MSPGQSAEPGDTAAEGEEPGRSGDDPSTQEHAPRAGVRRFLGLLGPGLVTGAADDDPSGIATYAQAGAAFSNGMLWAAPATFPMMMAVQEICDRTALATGDNLGKLARRNLMAVGQGMELLGAGPDHVWSAVAGIGIAVALMTGSSPS